MPYMKKREKTSVECYRHPKRLGFAEKTDVLSAKYTCGYAVHCIIL